MHAQPPLREMTSTQVHVAMCDPEIVLVDVRFEPQEYVAERIHGALLFPLSSFNARATAAAKCVEGGVSVTAQMKGGILAWKHARYPTITLDPNTGAVVDRK
jgi:rhodanese-related sulfurtransferase